MAFKHQLKNECFQNGNTKYNVQLFGVQIERKHKKYFQRCQLFAIERSGDAGNFFFCIFFLLETSLCSFAVNYNRN
jgi:hypothetical protein